MSKYPFRCVKHLYHFIALLSACENPEYLLRIGSVDLLSMQHIVSDLIKSNSFCLALWTDVPTVCMIL